MQIPDYFEHIDDSGGISEFRLKSNELQVLILPDSTAPVATFMVTYRVGSRNESAGLTGATHFLEHLMFKGSERFNKKQNTSVFNVLQRVGAQINATTWYDRTNYYELLPSEHLPLAIEVEADRMRGALIDPAEMESERTVILNELDRGENEPIRNLYHAVWSVAFLAHPYHHPTIGWRSDVETVTPESLRHFYDTFYWPRNATVSIIGDVRIPQVLDLVHRTFGTIDGGPDDIPSKVTREPEQRGERRIVVRQTGQLGAVMIAFKSPDGLHADSDALDLLSVVLGSGKTSRLYRRLTDEGLTTYVNASASRLRDPGLFYLFAMLAPGHTHEEVEAAIYEVVRSVQEDGVTEAELIRARNQLRAHEAFERDGPHAVASQLNEAIAAGDWKLYTTFQERINAVSADDVRRVAGQYCIEDRRTVGYYVPTE